MATELTYYIYEGILTGFVGGVFIHVLALSGGGGGSTKTASTFVSNNPSQFLMDRNAKAGGGMLHVLEMLGNERFS